MRCSSLIALVAAIAFLACLVTCTVSVSGHHHHGKVQVPVTAADRAASWVKSSHSHGHHQSSFTPFDRDNDRDDHGHDDDNDDRDDNDLDDDDDDEYMPFGDRSSICRQYDCPRFNATSYPTYTIRTYPSTTVACSVIRSFKYGANEQTRAFQRLYEYFGGESDQGTKINMTVPVIRYVKPGNGSHPNVTVCFFLPESLSGNPPKPKNSDVLVFNTSFTVAIKPFFGWGTHANVGVNLIRHQFALSLVGQDWVTDRYVHAAYTEPWIPFFRYNEIWTLIPSQHSPREDDLMSQMEQPRSPSQPQPQPQHQHHGRRRFHTRPRLLQDTM